MGAEHTLPADQRFNSVAELLREGIVAEFEAVAAEFFGDIIDLRKLDDTVEEYAFLHPDVAAYFFGVEIDEEEDFRVALFRATKFTATIVNQLASGDTDFLVDPIEYLRDLAGEEDPRRSLAEDTQTYIEANPVLQKLFEEYQYNIDPSGKYIYAVQAIYAVTLMLAEREIATQHLLKDFSPDDLLDS